MAIIAKSIPAHHRRTPPPETCLETSTHEGDNVCTFTSSATSSYAIFGTPSSGPHQPAPLPSAPRHLRGLAAGHPTGSRRSAPPAHPSTAARRPRADLQPVLDRSCALGDQPAGQPAGTRQLTPPSHLPGECGHHLLLYYLHPKVLPNQIQRA